MTTYVEINTGHIYEVLEETDSMIMIDVASDNEKVQKRIFLCRLLKGSDLIRQIWDED